MNNNKKEKIIGLIALGCVGVIVVAVVLWKVLGAGSEQINIQYGVPVDYEKEGFVTLRDYKNISISVGVSEEDVQEEIDYIIESAELYEEKQGKAATGDMVNIDYEATLDGVVIESESDTDLLLTLGEEEVFTEFDEGIAGMNTGDTKVIDVEIPKDYGDEMIDGKTVQYEVTLNYICGDEIEAELTDEFVKDYTDGECLSVIEFDDYINNQLYQTNVENITDEAWTKVIEESEVKEYHSEELDKAVAETEKSYESFAEFAGYSSMEELLSDYEMTSQDVEEIGQEMAEEKMLAKSIAAKEGLSLNNDEYAKMLVEYMEYEDEADKNRPLEEIEKDFEESYSENPKDAMLLEMVKNYVADLVTVEGMRE